MPKPVLSVIQDKNPVSKTPEAHAMISKPSSYPMSFKSLNVTGCDGCGRNEINVNRKKGKCLGCGRVIRWIWTSYTTRCPHLLRSPLLLPKIVLFRSATLLPEHALLSGAEVLR